MSVAARWRLHPLHLFLVRKYLGIEDLVLPLDGPAYGRTMRQVGELVFRELPAMRRCGVVDGDEVDPGLAEALRVLAKPRLWADSVWFPRLDRDAMWRAVAVAQGSRTVLGVQEPGETDRFGGVLTVELHDGTTLAGALIPTLPPMRPGHRSPVRIPESSLRAAADEQGSPLREATDTHLAAYRAIATAEHLRGGELAANLRTPRGGVTRSRTVKWFDNAEPDGRYLDHADRSGAGELVHVITPADARFLGNTVERLTHSVRATAR